MEERVTFQSKETYAEPTDSDLGVMALEPVPSLFKNLTPSSTRDNRDVARAILYALHAPDDIWDFVLPAIDSGYYKVSDGTSCVFWRQSPISERAGLPDDLAAWAHDYAYYCGMEKSKADFLYFRTMRLLGVSFGEALIKYLGVKLFGHKAYALHAAKMKHIPNYGRYLPVVTLDK